MLCEHLQEAQKQSLLLSCRGEALLTSVQRPKEVNLERLKELSEKHKAKIHVPFHSLNHKDDEVPQSLLERADHDLVGESLCCLPSATPHDTSASLCGNCTGRSLPDDEVLPISF